MSVYSQGSPPSNPEDLTDFIDQELTKIFLAFETLSRDLILKQEHNEPGKVYDGLILYADGTNWNPDGTGRQGPYIYFTSDSKWHYMGETINLISPPLTETGHGFAVGDVVYNTGSAWAKARSDVASTSTAIGVVGSIADVDTFNLIGAGFITGLSSLTPGTTYYLDEATAGTVRSTAPGSPNIVKPIYTAISSSVALVHWSLGFQAQV